MGSKNDHIGEQGLNPQPTCSTRQITKYGLMDLTANNIWVITKISKFEKVR